MYTPWTHQRQSADLKLKEGLVFDMSDPGTGKTAAHLLAYTERKNPRRLLIVATRTLMRSAWGSDITRFFPFLGVTYADAGSREAAFKSRSDVVIINTDGVKQVDEKWLADFDDLIVDESSYFKHASAQRAKAMARIAKRIPNRSLLSATPNPVSVTELWHQAFILDRGQRLGTSFTKFRYATQYPEQCGPSANHIKWIDKPEAELAAYSLLKDISIRHKFEDVMTGVPPTHKTVYEFELGAKAKKAYITLERDSLLATEGKVITGVHKAAVRQKLLQVCSGAAYSENGEYVVIDTARYELVADLMEERAHSIAFFLWRHQKEQMILELTKRGMTFAVIDGDTPDHRRAEIVNEFQAGQYQTLLLHPRTGAHGLTLTAADTCFIISPIIEADLMEQGIRRIYRGGQDKVTNIVYICAKGTVEELVYGNTQAKDERMKSFLNLIGFRVLV